jgi:hypothetical protein
MAKEHELDELHREKSTSGFAITFRGVYYLIPLKEMNGEAFIAMSICSLLYEKPSPNREVKAW